MTGVDRILWRELQPGDYYNVEKPAQPGVPRGQLHVDMPTLRRLGSSLVSNLSMGRRSRSHCRFARLVILAPSLI